jgi:hypothetical protein
MDKSSIDERESIARWAAKKAETLEALGRTRVPPAGYPVSIRRLRRIAELLRGERNILGAEQDAFEAGFLAGRGDYLIDVDRAFAAWLRERGESK